MIETYKIITGKYYAGVEPTLPNGSTSITRGNDLRLQNIMSSMICVNLVLQTSWLIHGTAYQIGLCLLILLITFK